MTNTTSPPLDGQKLTHLSIKSVLMTLSSWSEVKSVRIYMLNRCTMLYLFIYLIIYLFFKFFFYKLPLKSSLQEGKNLCHICHKSSLKLYNMDLLSWTALSRMQIKFIVEMWKLISVKKVDKAAQSRVSVFQLENDFALRIKTWASACNESKWCKTLCAIDGCNPFFVNPPSGVPIPTFFDPHQSEKVQNTQWWPLPFYVSGNRRVKDSG